MDADNEGLASRKTKVMMEKKHVGRSFLLLQRESLYNLRIKKHFTHR